MANTLSLLLDRVRSLDPELAKRIGDEIDRRSKGVGLVFEHHEPEAVALPSLAVKEHTRVAILPPRGVHAEALATSRKKADRDSVNPLWGTVWTVESVGVATATLVNGPKDSPASLDWPIDDLIVMAEFRYPIYPGLVSTGKVERGFDKPFHTVINGENFHALEMLTYTHPGQIDAIYIDPPYNTRARDWKYNNDYVDPDDDDKHSKWLAFMERRLKLAQKLLNPDDSVLIVTIDENEHARLSLLLEQMFPEARINNVVVTINPKGTPDNGFGRVEEFVIFVAFGAASPRPVLDPMFGKSPDLKSTRVRWRGLTRTGANGVRSKSPGAYYPIFIDQETGFIAGAGEVPSDDDNGEAVVPPSGTVAVWPTPRPDGTPGRWSVVKAKFEQLLEIGAVRTGQVNFDKNEFPLWYLTDPNLALVKAGEMVVTGRRDDRSMIVEYAAAASKRTYPRTVWTRAAHSASEHGSGLLTSLLKSRPFPYPKSLYAVEDALRLFVGGKPDAVVLDFFAGSGTTAHAVMRLNKQDGGRRQSISVTNNEVSAEEQVRLRSADLRPGDPDWEQWGICEYITKPRITAAIVGETPTGEPIEGDYKFTDEFPMSEGFKENAEFFTLTYGDPDAIEVGEAFEAIAPLLWMKAGSRGQRIESIPDEGYVVSETYAILFDLDQHRKFTEALEAAQDVNRAFIITDYETEYARVASTLPPGVESERLYRSYLSNFEII
ncbi:site-specific DNA-methyltransferase [Arthrobacter sp. NPDC093139]|uniref:site-specific DNA-methyltransferase n=1 Tax=Arthrobacter sp. NPDC093139 TaxID=3363945 RepID=UPI003816484D